MLGLLAPEGSKEQHSNSYFHIFEVRLFNAVIADIVSIVILYRIQDGSNGKYARQFTCFEGMNWLNLKFETRVSVEDETCYLLGKHIFTFEDLASGGPDALMAVRGFTQFHD